MGGAERATANSWSCSIRTPRTGRCGRRVSPDVRERMIARCARSPRRTPNGTAAVFSHGMAIRLTVGTLQGLSLHEIDGTGHAENTAVSRLEYENGAFRVAYRDDASHLENGAADAQAAGVAEERARLRGRYLLCALRRRGAF